MCPSLIRAVRVRGRHFNGRQPSGLNKNNLNISTAGCLLQGGGAYSWIKIPQQDFAVVVEVAVVVVVVVVVKASPNEPHTARLYCKMYLNVCMSVCLHMAKYRKLN